VKLALAVLSGFLLLMAVPVQSADRDEPRLRLRTARRIAFSPVEVFFVAELVGGDEIESFYCPALVWEWGDGSRSVSQSDCPPFSAEGELQRFFTARHVYRHSGNHEVRLTLRKVDRAVASAAVSIQVRSRFGN
jgi:hypothetical protein